MKKFLLSSIGILVGVALVLGGIFYWKNFRGVWPSVTKPSQKMEDMLPSSNDSRTEAGEDNKELLPINNTDMPLQLPSGFSISIFAKDLPGARVMVFDELGNLWVSQTSQGIISRLELQGEKVVKQEVVLSGLKKPHGLAFDLEDSTLLYFAEENKISKVRINPLGTPEKIIDLPGGGNHFTRTLGFGPDGRLYVSIGSSCNVCNEKDSRRAKIFSLQKDGKDFKEFATGLRNSVFFTWHPHTEKIWATDMGRDLIGDDIPSDEINIVEQGKDYGWPYCYGKNIPDPFGKDIPAGLCGTRAPSHIDIQAHSAPLGLAFIPEQGWPEEYKNNLLVAYHGSWNRSTPTGYKIVRYRLDKQGNIQDSAKAEDFITGWLTDNEEALGRPVDIAVKPNGIIYISDDKAGVIYKVWYASKN